MSTFKELNLSKNLLDAMDKMGYETPTSIQAQAIPLVVDGHDLVGQSKTGSGKTAAFSIPSLMQIDTQIKEPQILIIAPTRELALQITDEMRRISEFIDGVFYATLYGGEPISRQFKDLKKANVVVGTPGRILDHIKRRTLKLKTLKIAILDEADEMLSMGFLEDIQDILKVTPKTRQTLLFSATMPKAIQKLSQDFLKNPEHIKIKDTSVAGRIEQYYYEVVGRQKKQATASLINFHNAQKTIIFCNTKAMVDDLATYLRTLDIKAGALHGDMQQNTRIQVLNEFKKNQLDILVATDVAARGIDVDNVDLVVNFDIPQSYEYYTHRIGRTGRAGKNGFSLTLVSGRQQFFKLKDIMRVTQQEITKQELPTAEMMNEQVITQKADSIIESLQKPLHPSAEKLLKLLKKQTHLTEEALLLVLANEWAHSLEGYEELQAPKQKKERNVKVMIPLGKKDKIRNQDLSKALNRQFKIKNINNISTFKKYTTFSMPKKDFDRIKSSNRNFRFNSQSVEIKQYARS